MLNSNRYSKIVYAETQRMVYKNPLLYRIYYNLYRKKKGVRIELPNIKTDLHLAGYPRSGNTFARFLINKFIGGKDSSIKIVSHNHSVAGLKIANEAKILNVILVRNPLEAIISSYIKHYALRNCEPPEKMDVFIMDGKIKLYLDYYNFTHDIINDKNCLVEFRSLIENPIDFIGWLQRKLFLDCNYLTAEEIENAKVEFFGKEESKNPLGSSLPNSNRDVVKEKLIEKMTNHHRMKEAQKIYNKIISKKVEFSNFE